MAIDVPYSYLLRDGDLAWTCGQLALDENAEAVAPGDLVAQSEIVCGHIEAVLDQANLDPSGVARACVYTAPAGSEATAAMLDAFRSSFGRAVDLVVIPVPHFYYPGVELEVDVLWVGSGRELAPCSGPGSRRRLVEHGVVPGVGVQVDIADPGAAVVASDGLDHGVIVGLDVQAPDVEVDTDVSTFDDAVVVVRHSPPFSWIQGRGTDPSADLVSQTRAVMDRIAHALEAANLNFGDVAKSTTHYAGGATPEELHDNMAVRNQRYSSPGPASTGIPVRGFADPASRVVVDLTIVRRQNGPWPN